NYTPDNVILAALFIIAIYGVKSMTVVFPLALIEMASGLLFRLPIALVVNVSGLMLCIYIPHKLGRFLGSDRIDELIKKYPKFGYIVQKEKDNSFFICYFTRVVGCLPGDLLSAYFGASGVSAVSNVFGGILGMFPSMVLTTIFGQSIRQPGSKLFWVSLGLNVCLSIVSFVVFYFYKHKNIENNSK
ncbi:MAG: TVP38/TMEM64 family protein, partial [Erysipelotrichaceae bacterium]